jgi:hypothetical protein
MTPADVSFPEGGRHGDRRGAGSRRHAWPRAGKHLLGTGIQGLTHRPDGHWREVAHDLGRTLRADGTRTLGREAPDGKQ